MHGLELLSHVKLKNRRVDYHSAIFQLLFLWAIIAGIPKTNMISEATIVLITISGVNTTGNRNKTTSNPKLL